MTELLPPTATPTPARNRDANASSDPDPDSSGGAPTRHPSPAPTATPTPSPTPTPTPAGTATPIHTSPDRHFPTTSPDRNSHSDAAYFGKHNRHIPYCSNPVPGPMPNVTLTLSGSASGSMMTDGSGNYQFSSLAAGGSYTVTPTKAALAPASGASTP